MQEMRDIQVQALGGEALERETTPHRALGGEALERETTPHSSITAWKIPGTEEPGRLRSMGLQE